MAAPQNYANHTRFDPLFHFTLIPILLGDIVFAVARTIRHWPDHWLLHVWWIVMSVALLLMAERARSGALKVQDRVIRVEENLRYARLLPADAMQAASTLTMKQVVALRFASDAELPALVQRALSENLPPKVIKQAIQDWKPDHVRV